MNVTRNCNPAHVFTDYVYVEGNRLILLKKEAILLLVIVYSQFNLNIDRIMYFYIMHGKRAINKRRHIPCIKTFPFLIPSIYIFDILISIGETHTSMTVATLVKPA